MHFVHRPDALPGSLLEMEKLRARGFGPARSQTISGLPYV
jgi:hypothetical protein